MLRHCVGHRILWGNFTDLIRRIGSDNSEDLRLYHVKCKITNRMAVGFSTLKLGSEKLGWEDEKNLVLGDFAQVSNTELEDHFLVENTAEKKPPNPKTIEDFRRCVENQINLWCLFFRRTISGRTRKLLAKFTGFTRRRPGTFYAGFPYRDMGSDGVRLCRPIF